MKSRMVESVKFTRQKRGGRRRELDTLIHDAHFDKRQALPSTFRSTAAVAIFVETARCTVQKQLRDGRIQKPTDWLLVLAEAARKN